MIRGDRMLEVNQEQALCAAGMGAWDWDVPADQLCWTPEAARLFGLDHAFIESLHAFLSRVDPADRERVDALIASAFEAETRAVMEFRAVRSDGSLRWLRCIGRGFTDGHGHAVRMSGVIDDFTEQRAPNRPLPPQRPHGSFTTSQVAQILGIAEASVKRLADAGAIACLRSSPRGRRFFTTKHLMDYLRGPRREAMRDLAQALHSLDMKEAVAQVIDELGRGRRLEDVLDAAILPDPFGAPSGFTADLLKRLGALVYDAHSRSRTALVARVGDATLETRMIECVLRAAGFEVLCASDSVTVEDLAGMAERVGAEFAIFVIGRCHADLHPAALTAAGALARRLSDGKVCIQASQDLQVPIGVSRVRTMAELGQLLRGA